VSVDDLLAKADSRLTAAARDLEAGDVERSLSASYYAMFYAASAALERVGVSSARSPVSGNGRGNPGQRQVLRGCLSLAVALILRSAGLARVGRACPGRRYSGD